MPKKDVSTSCNDLCLDSPLCNQACIEKVIIETCTQEVERSLFGFGNWVTT
jgi:hypothetical protein